MPEIIPDNNQSARGGENNQFKTIPIQEIIQIFYLKMVNIYITAVATIDQFAENSGVYAITQKIQKTFEEHPFLKLAVLTAGCAITVPICFFVLIAFICSVLALTGFIIIEGALFTMASVFFFGFLCTVIAFVMMSATVLTMGYFITLHFYTFVHPVRGFFQKAIESGQSPQ